MIQFSEVIADANAILASSALDGVHRPELSLETEAAITALVRRYNRALEEINPTAVPIKNHPSRDDAIKHALSCGLPASEGNRFFDYYESNGWRVGKNPMRNWRSAMSNWKKTWDERQKRNTSGAQMFAP